VRLHRARLMLKEQLDKIFKAPPDWDLSTSRPDVS
jgi:hypothetical protein